MTLINIERKILKDIIKKIDSIDIWVVFLYWSSWSWKTNLIESLKEHYEEWIYLNFEDYNKFDYDNLWLWTQIKDKFWAKDDLVIQNNNSIKVGDNSILTDIYQKTEIKVELDEKYIKEKVKFLFSSYNQGYIYLDAIENILQWDYHFTMEIINILVKNNVKVIITSRNLDKNYQENSFEINHFSQEEFDDYFENNFKWFEQYKENIENLCRISSDNYDNIRLSLLLTLYIEDKDDLFDLISETKNQIKTLFEIWKDHIGEDMFRWEIKEKIIRKILWKNEILETFLKKVFLLKSLNKNLLDIIWITYSNEEWEIYEKFIKINWYKHKDKTKENPETIYNMHDIIYNLLKDYYFVLLKKVWVNSDEIYRSLFNTIKYWVNNRFEISIKIDYILKLYDLIKLLIEEKENKNDIANLLMNMWVVLYSLWKYNESLKKYEWVYEMWKKLLEKDPDNDSLKNDIARVLTHMWNSLDGLLKYKEAITKYELVYEMLQELLEKDPDNDNLKNDITSILINMWVVLNSLWKYKEAITKYEWAYKIRKELLEKDPDNYYSLKNNLDKILNNVSISIDGLSFDEKIVEINRLINTYPKEQFFRKLW